MQQGIDWQKLKERLAQGFTPKVIPPRKKKAPETAEELEAFREKERQRNKAYRQNNPDKVHEREKRWRNENPDLVKAKKKRFYEKHKQDPEWVEKKRAKQRAYKLRKRLERQSCYTWLINEGLVSKL